MKAALVILLIGLCNITNAQPLTASGYWLPLKRLENADRLKTDLCDSAAGYPFKKIKFFSATSISLFGFNAADPSVCTIIPLRIRGEWKVKNTIVHTLCPEFVFESKITLKLRNDTLYVSLSKNGVSFRQIFVRKYDSVTLTDYGETEVGNILLKGQYTRNGTDTILFSNTGKTELLEKKDGWNFISYKLKNYAPESCRTAVKILRGIIELTDIYGNKEEYFIEITFQKLDFYKIIKRGHFWSKSLTEHAFSLSRTK